MRKELTVTIQDEGRDKGKAFLILEMSAEKAERWAIRASQALVRAGMDIGDTRDLGMEGLARLGIAALFRVDDESLDLLLEEMFSCIEIIPDPSKPNVHRKLLSEDIEEVVTRIKLRMEVFELHTGFSLAGNKSTPGTSSTSIPPASQVTKMSRRR